MLEIVGKAMRSYKPEQQNFVGHSLRLSGGSSQIVLINQAKGSEQRELLSGVVQDSPPKIAQSKIYGSPYVPPAERGESPRVTKQ